jgi:uncharacterized protein YihD (DUF1040 family)
MFQYDKLGVAAITEALKDEGYLVSRAGVGRAIRKKKLDMKRFDEALQSAQAIVKATEGKPGTDIGEAALQLTLTKLLDELKAIESFKDLSDNDVVLAVARISRSLAAVSRLKLDYEKGFKAGLFRAIKELETKSRTPEETAAHLRKILEGSAGESA